MSHTTSIKAIKITDIAALRSAVNELQEMHGIKCSLTENAKPRAYYADQQGMGIAPYVLVLDNARYDVGFYESGKTPNGETAYEARTDFFGGTVQQQLGVRPEGSESADQARMGKLYQAYGIHATMNALANQGVGFERTTVEGKEQLIVNY